MIWIGTYLVKDEDGDVTGFSTAVKASSINTAVTEVENFIRKEHPTMDKFYITDVGFADDDAEEHIGHSWIDPLSDDIWPEEEE